MDCLFARFSSLAGIAAALLLAGCTTADKPVEGSEKKAAANKETAAKKDSDVNISFLLSMDFAEASAISAKHMEVPPFVKVAADEIEVLKTDAQGKPRKVRARGHVFLQLDYAQQAHALGQEALISNEDVILRGNPVLQRGQSLVEGVADITVFYLMGTRLRAIGPHKVNNASSVGQSRPLLMAWQSGPNPLLPPLQDGSVPDSVRDEMRKAAEAEEALQKSRIGQPMAFPEALDKPIPIDDPVTAPAPKPAKEEGKKPEGAEAKPKG